MIKPRVSFMMLVVLLISGITRAEKFDIYPFTYQILSEEDRTVSVSTLYDIDETELRIPETVTLNEKEYKVISIFSIHSVQSLETLIIPNSVEDIALIQNCPSLTNVYIGSSLKEIGILSFTGTKAYFIVDEGNPYFIAQDGILYNQTKSVLVLCKRDLEDGFFSIPESVKTIGEGAFHSNKSLSKVIIPASVNEISLFAFGDCYELKSILCYPSLPPGYLNCSEGGTGFTLPVSVYVPDEFYESYELKWGTDYSVYPMKYYPVSPLEDIISGFTYNILSSDDNLLEISGFKGLLNEDKELKIPSSISYMGKDYEVVRIGRKAFENEASIKIVSIPESINTICAKAFMYCTGLYTVLFYSDNPPLLGSDIFYMCDFNHPLNIYVPDSSLTLYKNASIKKYNIYPISELESLNEIKLIEFDNKKPFRIFSIDGRYVTVVNSYEDVINLPRGMYIINGKKILLP